MCCKHAQNNRATDIIIINLDVAARARFRPATAHCCRLESRTVPYAYFKSQNDHAPQSRNPHVGKWRHFTSTRQQIVASKPKTEGSKAKQRKILCNSLASATFLRLRISLYKTVFRVQRIRSEQKPEEERASHVKCSTINFFFDCLCFNLKEVSSGVFIPRYESFYTSGDIPEAIIRLVLNDRMAQSIITQVSKETDTNTCSVPDTGLVTLQLNVCKFSPNCWTVRC